MRSLIKDIKSLALSVNDAHFGPLQACTVK
jgi:hypothetical protein